MNKHFYWILLLTSCCSSLGGLAVAIAESQIEPEYVSKSANSSTVPAESSQIIGLEISDNLLVAKPIFDTAHEELNHVANIPLVTATINGQFPPEELGVDAPQDLASSPEVVAPQTVAIVKEFEGFRHTAYLDTDGTPVIGYGQSKIYGERVNLGDRVPLAVADAALNEELQVIQKEILDVVDVDLTNNQLGAITSLAYNTGVHAIKKSTLIRRINRGDYLGAANEFIRWDKGNLRGRIVQMPGLARRRQKERQLFLTPEQPRVLAMNSEL